MTDSADYLEQLIEQLKALEVLTHQDFSFDINEYSLRTDDEFSENLDYIKQHILSTRPSHQNLKIIVLRTG